MILHVGGVSAGVTLNPELVLHDVFKIRQVLAPASCAPRPNTVAPAYTPEGSSDLGVDIG